MKKGLLFLMYVPYIVLFLFLCTSCCRGKECEPSESSGSTEIYELRIVKFDGGNVEWVSIQESTSADSKAADAKQDRNDIKRSNDTLYIHLYNISDEHPFDKSGKFIVVLKHDGSDKMYIKGALGGKIEFENGVANEAVKWGGWLAW